ncbi:hypothetical protein [Haliangium sp.]|uniref:hypothetical protein n=1 Tax=Haliangium sp. TaxID=2663208 RepID=UPI003D0F11D2
MHVVAITAEPADRAAGERAAADVIGRTLYEVRQLVSPPLPRAVMSTNDGAGAEAAATTLAAAGWGVTTIDGDALPSPTIARSLGFATDGLVVTDEHGREQRVPYSICRLLLIGVRTTDTATTETKQQRKFSASRALMTGGLSVRKKVKSEHTVRHSDSRSFARLVIDGSPSIELRDDRLQFQALGEHLQPTRIANWATTLDLLRRHAPTMTVDERLRQRVGWSRLLPPAFDPERHGEIAIAVLRAGLLPPTR